MTDHFDENKAESEKSESGYNPPPIPERATYQGTSGDAPFGGAPVTRPVIQKKQGRNWLPWATCLVIVIFVGIISIGLIMLAGRLIDTINVAPIQGKFGGPKNTIGIVRIDGAIYDERKALEVIRHYEQKDMRAILVRIDSPGGAVGPSQEIYDALMELSAQGRTVVTSMSGVAASGGYYIACGTDRIFSNPGTMTGSIGVIMSIPDLQGVSQKVGIGMKTIKSGKFKDAPSALRDMTAAELAMLQNVINDTYDQFVDDILETRKDELDIRMRELLSGAELEEFESLEYLGQDVMPVQGDTPESYLRRIADGRIMTGRQAYALGLVDELGSQQDAVDWIAKELNMTDPKPYEYVPVRPLSELLGASAESTLKSVGLPLGNARLEYRMPY